MLSHDMLSNKMLQHEEEVESSTPNVRTSIQNAGSSTHKVFIMTQMCVMIQVQGCGMIEVPLSCGMIEVIVIPLSCMCGMIEV